MTHGVEYIFQLRAVNATGDGVASDESTAAKPALPKPAAPVGLTATAAHQSAVLTWTNPNNSTITKWQYTKDDGTTWTDICVTSSDSNCPTKTSHTVGSLTNRTEYKFKIRAVNATGDGDESAEKSATPLPVPSAPANFEAAPSTTGAAQVSLTWDAHSDTNITKWQLRQSPSGGADFVAGTGAAKEVTLSWGNPNNSYIVSWLYRHKATTDDSWSQWTAMPGSNANTTSYTYSPALTNGKRHVYQVQASVNFGVGYTANDLQVRETISASATYKSHDAAGLAHNTLYNFRVRAVNAIGNGVESSASAAPVDAAPGKPALTAAGGDGQATLSWSKGDTVWADKWQYSKDNGTTWADVPSSTDATTSYTVTGLNAGSRTFRVRGANAKGDGTQSDAANANVKPGAAPSNAPTGFQAASGDEQVTLRWNAYTPAADVTGYEYRYKTTVGYGDWTSVSGQSTASVIVTGLDNGTAYTFQLRAVNHKGGGSSVTSDEVTPLPPLPLQPTGFMAKAGVQKVTLTWDDPDNDTITGYQYRQKTVNTWAAWTDIPNSDKDTITFERTGLTNDTLYTFKIRTTNLAGDGPESGEVTATPRALPAKPTGLTATGNNKQVALTWTNPNNDTITKWQYSKDGGTSWADVPNSVASTTTHNVPNLTNNTTYTFRVRAVNVSGESPQSDAVTGTPVAGKPEAPTLTATGGDAQVALSWSKGGSTHVVSWEYQYKTTGSYGSWTAVPSSSDSTTSYTVQSLDNGKTYTFQVRGKNDFGDGLGAVSSEVSAPTLPLMPANFTAAAKTGRTPIALFTEGQVDLTWTDPDNDAITDWQYQYKSKPAGGNYGNYGDWTSVTPAASGNNLTHTVTGLTNGTSYTFKVRAVNAAGNSPASDESGEATPTQPTPAKPAGFTATPMNASADLAWTDPGNSSITKWQMRHWTGSAADFVVGSGATGQEIALSWSASSTANITKWQYSTDGSTWTDICATSGNADCPATTARDITTSTALTEDQQYTYQVRAEVSAGTAPTVSNLQAWATISATASTAKHTAAGLTNATAYKFQIRAVNPAGAGEASDEATATPRNIPAAPSNLTATPSKTGAASATLKWDEHDDPTVNKWQLRRRADGASADFIVGTGVSQEITLEWTADANMGAPFDRWIFRHRVLQTPPKGPWSWNYISQNSNQTSHTFITKLTNGRRYEYDVFARLKTGNRYTPSNLKMWTKITTTEPETDKLGYVADGLIHNTRYSLILRAANPIGNGMTETATARPVAGVPGQPATISATTGDDKATTLTWTKNADGIWVDSWQYRKKLKAEGWPATAPYGWTDIANSNDATRSTTVGSLTNNQTYHFQVRGVNVAGNGTESTTIFAKPLAKPTKPANFGATGGDREINLKWTATSDTSTTGYRYQYKLWRAGDDGLSAEPGSAQAILSWDDPSDSAITKWQYRKKKSAANWPTTGTNGWTDIPSSGATTITYTVTGLINGTEYDFEVRSFTTSAQDALDGAQATPSVNEGLDERIRQRRRYRVPHRQGADQRTALPRESPRAQPRQARRRRPRVRRRQRLHRTRQARQLRGGGRQRPNDADLDGSQQLHHHQVAG